MFDIFALQVFSGTTAIEIQKMAKRFPMVDATGFAEYERRKHLDQFHGAGVTSTIGHIESQLHPRASRRLGEMENRFKPSIYLAVENFPRSGRAKRGEDRSLAAVRLGDRLPKVNKVVGSLAGIEEVLATGRPILDEDNRYQGPLNRQKSSKEMRSGRNMGGLSDSGNHSTAGCPVRGPGPRPRCRTLENGFDKQGSGEGRELRP